MTKNKKKQAQLEKRKGHIEVPLEGAVRKPNVPFCWKFENLRKNLYFEGHYYCDRSEVDKVLKELKAENASLKRLRATKDARERGRKQAFNTTWKRMQKITDWEKYLVFVKEMQKQVDSDDKTR